jgi:RHS repeat-associated protein
MTSYTNTVGGAQVQSNILTWNANGTLYQNQATGTLAGPSCIYGYDDLSRLSSVCGATNQSYTYDPFGNISKYGARSFQPTYDTATNQFLTLPTVPSGTTLYDANGNLINDGAYTYSWDAEGKMLQLTPQSGGTASTWTFDALGRWVETDPGSGSVIELGTSQAVYDPTGVELALATGSAPGTVNTHVPLAAGAWAQYTGTSLSSYGHPNWLGTLQLQSTPSGEATAANLGPFGEQTAVQVGDADTLELFTGSAFSEKGSYLWDFPAREYNWNQARWITPDPAAINAVDPTNPQSWNRYAYVLNNPLNYVDPMGLEYWWAGNCLYFDQYAYVNGELDSVDTYFIGCYNLSAGQFQLNTPGAGGSAAKQSLTNPCPPVPEQPNGQPGSEYRSGHISQSAHPSRAVRHSRNVELVL